MIIWHNSRCSKSRSACEILREKGIDTTVVEYLKTPPAKEEIRYVIKLLGIKAEQLVRKNEPLFKERFSEKTLSDEEWINILSENPILIERPIIINGNKAVIGRPPEKVLDIIG